MHKSKENVFGILLQSADTWPDKIAIYDEFGSISYRELCEAAIKLRDQLRSTGIGPGMAFGLKARNNRNFVIGLFAVVGCEATVVPMSHQLKEAEQAELLSKGQLHGFIEENLKNTSRQHFQIYWTNKDASDVFAPHIDDPAFMRFTSGTTGTSKGVIISHKSAIERIEAANKALKLGSEDTVIWVLPMAYHFVVSVLLYFRFGATMAIAKDFLADYIINLTNTHHGTLLYASPMQIRLLANDRSGQMLNSLKLIISTSTGISKSVVRDFEQRFNKPVTQAYGIIEIGLPMINLNYAESEPEAVGYALPDYEVGILDENYNELPNGTIGHLGIRGPGMFDGYLDPPMRTSEVLRNNYFLTADFAVKNNAGLITICGRSKSVIHVGGNKVFPEEVEQVLNSYPGIVASRVSGEPHPLMGQIIQAEVITADDTKFEVEDILTFCRRQLSTFKIPQRIRFVESLAMTDTGKIKR